MPPASPMAIVRPKTAAEAPRPLISDIRVDRVPVADESNPSQARTIRP
jgi:hypothetical protein